MVVLCINDECCGEGLLTYGRLYEVALYLDENKMIAIIADNNEISMFSIHRFKFIDDLREEKLKQLGI